MKNFTHDDDGDTIKVSNRAEFEFERIMSVFSKKARFFLCPLEINKYQRSVYFIPSFTGPFPDNFKYTDEDYIFDVSPALFRPWPKHLKKKLKQYITFPKKFTEKSLHGFKDLEDYKYYFTEFVSYFSEIEIPLRSRIIFVCSVPECTTHYLMGLSFFHLQKEILGMCDMWTMNFEYYVRMTDYHFIDYMRYTTFINMTDIRDSYNFSVFKDENFVEPFISLK